MATDFFERQDAARRSTKFLVVMFALGVLGIVGTTMAVAWAASTLTTLYRDNGGLKQHAEDLRDIKGMRDMQIEEIERRLGSLETAIRSNCH